MNTVAFLNPTADLYGASRALIGVVEQAVARGIRSIVVVPSDGPAVEAFERIGARVIVQPNLTVVRKPLLRGVGPLRLAGSLVASVVTLCKTIRQEAVDTVYSNSSVVITGAFAARRIGRPHLWHIRERFDELGPGAPLYARFVEAMANVILCNAHATRTPFRHGANATVVPDDLPLDTSDIAEKPLAVSGRPVLATLGRLSPRKGMHILIEAFEELRRTDYPNAALIMGGDCYPGNEPYRDRLHAQVHRAGLDQAVTFTGYLPAPGALYAAADLFCLPTTRPEGFGLVALEAIAHGLPVVVSRHGGLVDFVEEGINGFYAVPGDVLSVTGAIRAALTADLNLADAAKTVRARYAYPTHSSVVVDHLTALIRSVGPATSGPLEVRCES